ncbi:hypothetical protein [Marivirga sp.]|uniref:hypothetical protein n=1 Tax=Marivirga sp. TaxID=2018662 RepID=UPI003DA795DB
MMKKLMRVLFALVFCFASLSYSNASCDGNSYTVTNWDDYAAEFAWNCCAGDVITVTDLSTGQTTTKTLRSVYGPNSSCA